MPGFVPIFDRPRDRALVLSLADGSHRTFLGWGLGGNVNVSGEVVFSTSMVGYSESLTGMLKCPRRTGSAHPDQPL